jgi:hypothetical protein
MHEMRHERVSAEAAYESLHKALPRKRPGPGSQRHNHPADKGAGLALCPLRARREPVFFAQPDNQTLERVRPGGREIISRYACFLAVPATAGAEVPGS